MKVFEQTSYKHTSNKENKMTSFEELKKNRTAHLTKLSQKLGETNQTPFEADNRVWQPTVDKAGNGYAIIRFLPEPKGEDTPVVRIWDHGFKGPGGWYIEKSLTTIGKQDPVSEFNTELWNSTTDDKSPQRKQARDQKRRLKHYSNILVVNDPEHPENNGKVFLYSYGKKIFDKLNDVMNPKFPDEKPINPFDMWEGANFKIKIRQVEGYRNYDSSSFAEVSPVSTDEDVMKQIYESEYPLQPFVDPKNFKDYNDLKAKLTRVLGKKPAVVSSSHEEDSAEVPFSPPYKAAASKAEEVEVAEDDESDAFFTKLRALADK
jgi:hypothetical protein